MEQGSWQRMAEALLLLCFTPEELARRTPHERRLLAVMQFVDLPDDDGPVRPDQTTRRRLGKLLAAARAHTPLDDSESPGSVAP